MNFELLERLERIVEWLPIDVYLLRDYLKVEKVLEIDYRGELIKLEMSDSIRLKKLSDGASSGYCLSLYSDEANIKKRGRDYLAQIYVLLYFIDEGKEAIQEDYLNTLEILSGKYQEEFFAGSLMVKESYRKNLAPFALELIDIVDELIEKKERAERSFSANILGSPVDYKMKFSYEAMPRGGFRAFYDITYQKEGGEEKTLPLFVTSESDNAVYVSQLVLQFSMMQVLSDLNCESIHCLALAMKVVDLID